MYIYVYTHTCICVYIRKERMRYGYRLYICMSVCKYLCVYMYIKMVRMKYGYRPYVCVCVHIYIRTVIRYGLRPTTVIYFLPLKRGDVCTHIDNVSIGYSLSKYSTQLLKPSHAQLQTARIVTPRFLQIIFMETEC